MKKIFYLYFILFLFLTPCLAKKESVILVKDPYTMEDVNKLKISYLSGEEKALETLINISSDKNQILKVRLSALDIISTSEHPMLKTALKEIISEAEFVELEIMSKTIEILLSLNDLKSSETLIDALLNSENKIMDFRTSLIEAIGQNNTEDKVLALVDLYDISLQNHQRMNELLTLTLGNIDDNRSIPILMEIAENNSIDLRVRSRAIEILSRKNAPELVDFFIRMLGTPGSNNQMMNFINNSMGLVEKDRLLMALLESYQTGKTRYYAVIYSIMDSLKDYDNPNIKPVFIEVAKTDGYPKHVRIKAIQSLVHFNDKTVLDELIPLLEDYNNYDYYYELLNLSKELDVEEEYAEKFRLAEYKAMQKN